MVHRERDRVKVKQIAPRLMPCPVCGALGRRREVVEVLTRDIAYRQRAWLVSRLGVYRSSCACQQFFQAENPEAAHGWKYTVAVRQAVVDGIVRDHLSIQKLLVRFKEDFEMNLSEGFVFQCLEWADKRFDVGGYLQQVAQRFSGVLCIDELYDGEFKVVFATDPQLDETVGFRVVDAATREQVEPFLIELRDRGIRPTTVITDDAKLYPKMLQSVWPGVDHQTCLFHFMKTAGQAILKAVRKVTKKLPGPPKRRRGRPSKRGRPRKQVSDRQFTIRHRHLIVKRDEKLTEKDEENLDKLLSIHPDLGELRDFAQRLRAIFEPGITQQQARYRRTQLLSHPAVQLYPHQLRGIIARLTKGDSFDKLISFLVREDGERTSNHVERTNRGFRFIQKTRYRNRSRRGIERSIRLDLQRRSCRPRRNGDLHGRSGGGSGASNQQNMGAALSAG